MQGDQINKLATILRRDGDQILDATSRLSISASILSCINEKLLHITLSDQLLNDFIDLGFIYDFVQQTLALKIFQDDDGYNKAFLDLSLFSKLKLLEVHRLSLNLIKGLKCVRSQLEYMTCMRSVDALKDVLESCGADKAQGYVWRELREATFSHNNLRSVDNSLEFAPWLQSLDLSYNSIENIEVLNCLGNLRYLNLANNQIEQLPVFKCNLCNKLQVLILRNNFIDGIGEIGGLFNLKELDLSNNHLLQYENLLPLTNLSRLQTLSLTNNPLCYDSNYRCKTSAYLHDSASSNNFKLDNQLLRKQELRAVGTVQPAFLRSDSLNSTTTTCTVVPTKRTEASQTSDMEVSNTSIEVSESSRNCVEDTSLENTLVAFVIHEQGMQDSGFVAGPRPISPSESIGSATSLQNDNVISDHALRYSESDIEILSNPSQSSIEVLSNMPRCVRSCVIMPHAAKEMCLEEDVDKPSQELRRSL